VGSGSIVGSVTSASVLDYVRATRPCALTSDAAPRLVALPCPSSSSPTCPVLIHSGARSLARSHVLSTQANFVAVSGSYAYVTGMWSNSLVVVDISNPASPVIRGSVVSSSLLDHVRVTQSRGARMASGAALASATRIVLAPEAPQPASSLAHLLVYSHVLCTQPIAVAVSGSYAYVAGRHSNSLVVIDISDPASPVIRGSVVSSSLLDGVRVTLSCGARMASCAALRTIHHARARGASSC
jgi:hypothetical protein